MIRSIRRSLVAMRTRLALTYFDNPSDELRAACEAAALVVRTVQKVG